jgi:hypothetical protein
MTAVNCAILCGTLNGGSRRANYEELQAMSAIRATWRNGQIVPEGPVNWPEGLALRVEPASLDTDPFDERNDIPATEDEIARTLAAMELVEPFDLTPDEKAHLEGWEQKINEYTIANFDKGIEDVFR